MVPCYSWPKTALTSARPTQGMVIRESCPECGSKRYKKNGHTRHGKQNHQCCCTVWWNALRPVLRTSMSEFHLDQQTSCCAGWKPKPMRGGVREEEGQQAVDL